MNSRKQEPAAGKCGKSASLVLGHGARYLEATLLEPKPGRAVMLGRGSRSAVLCECGPAETVAIEMAFAKPEVRDLYAEQDRWKRRICAD